VSVPRALLLALASCAACRPSYFDGGRSHACDSEVHELQPRDSVEGQDPQTLLAPLYGTWRGPLDWRAGGSTELSVSIMRDPEAPLYRRECGPAGAYTSADVVVATSDGALSERLRAAVNWTSQDVSLYSDFSYVAIDLSPEADWQGSIAEQIPGLERYGGSGYLSIDLEHDPRTLLLLGGVVTYTGEAESTHQIDTLEVATWHVD
jgi:hypothetical protein